MADVPNLLDSPKGCMGQAGPFNQDPLLQRPEQASPLQGYRLGRWRTWRQPVSSCREPGILTRHGRHRGPQVVSVPVFMLPHHLHLDTKLKMSSESLPLLGTAPQGRRHTKRKCQVYGCWQSG